MVPGNQARCSSGSVMARQTAACGFDSCRSNRTEGRALPVRRVASWSFPPRRDEEEPVGVGVAGGPPVGEQAVRGRRDRLDEGAPDPPAFEGRAVVAGRLGRDLTAQERAREGVDPAVDEHGYVGCEPCDGATVGELLV